MKASEAVKPISYIKAHASEIIREIADSNKTLVITQNGVAKAILQDIKKYERTQESLTLLKMLALSSKSLKEQDYKPAAKAFQSISDRINHNKI